jgi:cystathionine gamma-synthase
VESLVEQPALMCYFELTTEPRQEVWISDSLVRFAVGFEVTQDLLAVLQQALESLCGDSGKPCVPIAITSRSRG